MSTVCKTSRCVRPAQDGDYLCRLCRIRRLQDSRPVPANPVTRLLTNNEYNPHRIHVRGLRLSEDE